MAVELPEIEGPAATAVRDLAVCVRGRPTAVGQALGLHPPKDTVELLIRNVKRVMVALQLFRHKMEDAPGVFIISEVDGEVLVDKCLFKINFILITKSLDDPFNILNQG
jgi:hypothetical protein